MLEICFWVRTKQTSGRLRVRLEERLGKTRWALIRSHSGNQIGRANSTRGQPQGVSEYPKNLFGLFLTSKGYFNFSGYLK